MMRFAVVTEKANGNYSAYVPDLPGSVATSATVEGVEREIREAIRFTSTAYARTACPCLPPTSIAEYVEA